MNFSAGDFNEFVYKNDDRVNDERDCMKLTTLCYIENDGCYLMLHRNKKEGDRVFLQLLQKQTEYFSLKLCYEGEKLAKALLNGREAENPSLVGDLKSIER